MSDMHPESIPVKIGDKTYGLRFTLNAIDAIQTHFDRTIADMPQIMDCISGHSGTRFILTTLINEGIDCAADETGVKEPHVKEDYIGRHAYDSMAVSEIKGAIYKAFLEHTNPPKSEDDGDPNPASE